jgi:hypothetical protein
MRIERQSQAAIDHVRSFTALWKSGRQCICRSFAPNEVRIAIGNTRLARPPPSIALQLCCYTEAILDCAPLASRTRCAGQNLVLLSASCQLTERQDAFNGMRWSLSLAMILARSFQVDLADRSRLGLSCGNAGTSCAQDTLAELE